MATRFYLPSTGAAPVSVTKSSYWDGIENSAQADNYASCKAVITTISSAMTSRSLDGNTDGGDTNYAYGQWISDPIAAQTLSAQNLKLQVRAFEESSRANQFVAISVRVVSNDGTVVRGTVIEARDSAEIQQPLCHH